MPSRFSGLSKRHKQTKPIPLFNPPAAKYDSASALIVANAMVAQVLKSLHEILKGPMASPCPVYLRAYVQTAAKTLIDLQAQFTNKMPGASDMDEVRVAASALLEAALDIDEDDISNKLGQVLASIDDLDDAALVSTIVEASSEWTEVKSIEAIAQDSVLHISGVIEKDCNSSCSAELDFNVSLPLASIDLKLRQIN
jgi:hypothetical protein